jgi:hypothetical protein
LGVVAAKKNSFFVGAFTSAAERIINPMLCRV